MTPDIKYWVALSRIPNLGTVRFRRLEAHFGALDQAWKAGSDELHAAGMDCRTARSIVTQRPNIDPDAEMEKLERTETLAINWHDPACPPRLKEIYDPPPVLYLKGQVLPEDERAVAVVGTRKATAYGREAAHSLAYDLARNGVTVVSGLARGIDGIAHRAALEAGGALSPSSGPAWM
jgi:DNA processing protein